MTAAGDVTRTLPRSGHDRVVAASVVGGVAVLYCVLRVTKHLSFGDGFDSTLLGNVMWRLSNGFDSQTAMTGGHYLSTHASLIVVPFLAVFRLAPEFGLMTIYAAQAASVALVGWSAHLLSIHLGISSKLRWVILAATLAAPGAFLASQFEVNETTLGLGPLAMAIVLAITGNRVSKVAPWLFIAASARIELAAAVLVAAGVLWSIDRRGTARLFAATGLTFLLAYGLWLGLNPYPTESIAAHFAHLGAGPGEVLATAVRRPLAVLEPLLELQLLASLFFWLLPFGVVAPLLSAKWLWVALPTTGVALFGVWPQADAFVHHYWYSLLVAGAVATPLAVARSEWLSNRFAVLSIAGLLVGWVIVAPAVDLTEMLLPDRADQVGLQRVVDTVRDLDPDYLSISTGLASRLVDRPLLAPFPRPFVCAEEQVGPYTAPDSPPDVIAFPAGVFELLGPETAADLRILLESYRLVEATGGHEIWQVDDLIGAQRAYVPCSAGDE